MHFGARAHMLPISYAYVVFKIRENSSLQPSFTVVKLETWPTVGVQLNDNAAVNC